MTKSVLVTGATDGIGFATAAALARLGWRVLVHGRNPRKAEAAAAHLRKSGDINLTVAVWADLSSMQEVLSLCDQVTAQIDALDALINNAGVYAARREISEDGLEMTMAVNHFAPFLLTHHLIPLLKNAATGRIVNVSSMTHAGAELRVDDLNLTRKWDAYGAYATSKLANLLFTRQLASNLKKTRVTANALHPGVVGTKLLRAGFSIAGDSPEHGARTSVYLANNTEVNGKSGGYYVDCERRSPSALANDAKLARKLWDASAQRLAEFL